MGDIKNMMYNYETTPPVGVWESIAAELDSDLAKVIPITRRSNKTLYYLAAAAVAIILFCLVFFTNQFSKSDEKLITSSENKSDTLNNVLITVPTNEKIIVKNNNESQSQDRSEKNQTAKKQIREVIKSTNLNNDNQIADNTASRYITIEGLQGQPVKVSSKMATLIDSSETKTASKPIWNKKINEWREIMKVNTLAPTTRNFLDIIELTKTLKDKQ